MDDQVHAAAGTKDRILDTAERLFAARGYRGTSIKQLAREANVNQAAVNYHFGSKAGLMDKVIERRADPLNRQRETGLDAVRQRAALQGGRPPVKSVLRAFIEPTFTLISSGTARKSFLALAGRALFEPGLVTKKILKRQFEPSFQQLVEVMHEALPDLPRAVLLSRLHFALGAMSHCMLICSIGADVSILTPPGADPDAVMNSLLAFTTAGLCAPVREGSDHESP